jgi:trk system potassium uptake protein
MRVVIAGAGMTGRRLMAKLAADHYDVVAIDLSRDVCEMVSAKLGVSAICGNATDIATLEEAEIERADVAVGMMHQSADNLAFSLLSKSSGAKRIITRMANPKYAGAYEQAGVTTVIDVTGLFLDRLVLEIERPEINEIASFGGGAGTILGVTVPERSHIVGKTVNDILSDRRYPRDCLIVGMFRKGANSLIIPKGQELVGAGDQLVLCALTATAKDIPQYFETRKGISSFFTGKRAQSAPLESSQTQAELDTALEQSESENRNSSQ